MADAFSELEFHLTAADLGGGVYLVSLGGEVDLDSAERLDGAFERVLDEPGAHSVVVDLSSVLFVDSTCLGRIVRVRGVTRAAGGDTAVVCGDGVARRAVRAAGLDRAFTSAPSVAAALALLRARSDPPPTA